MSVYLSKKLTNLSFVLSLLIVLIHSGTFMLIKPSGDIIYGQNVTTAIQLFIRDGICLVAVPLFFAISGYLFFRNFKPSVKSFSYKYKRRVFSLLIPFLIWNLAVIAVYYFGEKLPVVGEFIASSESSLANIGFIDFIKLMFLDLPNSPLWFVRDLMVLTILSPLVWLLAKKLPFVLIPVAFVLWFLIIDIYIMRQESLLFFSIGAVIALRFNGKLAEYKLKSKWILPVICVLWLGVLIYHTVYMLGVSYRVIYDGDYDITHERLNRIGILLGIPTVWYLYDLVARGSEKALPFSEYSFLIFVMHHPVIKVIKTLLLKITGVSEIASLIVFFAVAIVTVVIVTAVGVFMKRFAHPVYSVLVGKRN